VDLSLFGRRFATIEFLVLWRLLRIKVRQLSHTLLTVQENVKNFSTLGGDAGGVNQNQAIKDLWTEDRYFCCHPATHGMTEKRDFR
jgi:hypothetical protein